MNLLELEPGGLAERRVPIGDSRNARHMGGYAVAEGRLTREDRLFRSGWFALKDDVARDRLSSLGIKQIVDFRTSDELERKPLPVGSNDGIEIVSLPIMSGNMRAYIENTAILEAEDIDCKAAMVSLYTDIIEYAADAYQGMFAALARGEGAALLLCSAGKDRTGVGAALLLSGLGVSRSDLVSDYMMSADFYRGHEQELARQHGYERTGHSMDRFHDVFTVYPDYIEAAHRAAEERAGSMQALAAAMAGGEASLAKLRNRFTRMETDA